MGTLTRKLLPLVRNALSNQTRLAYAHTGSMRAVRLFTCSASRLQLRNEHGTNAHVLTGKVDRFGGVTVNIGDSDFPSDISEGVFSNLLRG